MIHNLSFNDETQKAILPHLQKTEFLLNKVTSKLSKTEKECNIYVMPDLGLPHNSTRMLGGFYTGSCYVWHCDIPFIPIDTTVNVCGTAVYKLSENISVQEFKFRLDNVLNNISKYDWNYDKGNHFVSLASSDGKYGFDKGLYMVVHASASEYKKQKSLGLYPEKDNWYYNEIKTEYLENDFRYLRYIEGKTAEKFYVIANFLELFNLERNRYFCEKVLGNLLEKEILNTSHYGMPNKNSVCIGVQWKNEPYTLLTAPSKNIYIVNPIEKAGKNNISNNILLSPHGLGLQITSKNKKIEYLENAFKIDNKVFHKEDSIEIGKYSKNRGIDCTYKELENTVHKILDICPGSIIGELSQICTFSKKGFEIYENNIS
ncbi:MAG: hypothetical protein OSJ66_02080 [Clostridia bacterium]|nr:hypothetical protein [Clostridia bacterium]